MSQFTSRDTGLISKVSTSEVCALTAKLTTACQATAHTPLTNLLSTVCQAMKHTLITGPHVMERHMSQPSVLLRAPLTSPRCTQTAHHDSVPLPKPGFLLLLLQP